MVDSPRSPGQQSNTRSIKLRKRWLALCVAAVIGAVGLVHWLQRGPAWTLLPISVAEKAAADMPASPVRPPPAPPVGWPACRKPVRDALRAMAEADALTTWRQGRIPEGLSGLTSSARRRLQQHAVGEERGSGEDGASQADGSSDGEGGASQADGSSDGESSSDSGSEAGSDAQEGSGAGDEQADGGTSAEGGGGGGDSDEETPATAAEESSGNSEPHLSGSESADPPVDQAASEKPAASGDGSSGQQRSDDAGGNGSGAAAGSHSGGRRGGRRSRGRRGGVEAATAPGGASGSGSGGEGGIEGSSAGGGSAGGSDGSAEAGHGSAQDASAAADGTAGAEPADSTPGSQPNSEPDSQSSSSTSSSEEEAADGAAEEAGSSDGSGGPTALVAITTANLWPKTELLLASLAGSLDDDFEVLVVDELSDDGTADRLRQWGVRVLQPDQRRGLTHNWNLAYRDWRNGSHAALFFLNNDVLVPDGAIGALTRALTPEGGDCDLVTPTGTIKGKGKWGPVEGMEKIFWLQGAARQFVNNPFNYQRVQDAMTRGGCAGPGAVQEWDAVQTKIPGFSGFFFGVRRGIEKWAFDEDNLFDPANRNIKQEHDLFGRLMSKDAPLGSGRVCIDTGTFVFHYKGSTIPYRGVNREEWRIPDSKPQA